MAGGELIGHHQGEATRYEFSFAIPPLFAVHLAFRGPAKWVLCLRGNYLSNFHFIDFGGFLFVDNSFFAVRFQIRRGLGSLTITSHEGFISKGGSILGSMNRRLRDAESSRITANRRGSSKSTALNGVRGYFRDNIENLAFYREPVSLLPLSIGSFLSVPSSFPALLFFPQRARKARGGSISISWTVFLFLHSLTFPPFRPVSASAALFLPFASFHQTSSETEAASGLE